jgi:hypothetical protein
MTSKNVRLCRRGLIVALAGALAFASGSAALAGPFSTFVSSSDLQTVEGQTNTIAFNYAGDKFVGSVYFGTDNLQLYSTNLTGGNVQQFGSPLPTGSGEVVLAAGLGQAGFTKGDIYASGNNNIYHYAGTGGAASLFGSTPDGSGVRQIFFDPGSSFGGNMLVSTTSGNIYKFNSSGVATLVRSVGEDTEGLDIASSAWGKYAGYLMVSSEGSGQLRLISPNGSIVRNTGLTIPLAETVSFVPLNLGVSGNPVEGFYVANYPVNVQKAGPSAFTGMLGDAIVTSEDGSNARIWDVKYDTVTDTFSASVFANLPNQSEDGIFVTADRINFFTPEPNSLTLLGIGVAGLAGYGWRKRKQAAA